jgi:hypothetical protein
LRERDEDGMEREELAEWLTRWIINHTIFLKRNKNNQCTAAMLAHIVLGDNLARRMQNLSAFGGSFFSLHVKSLGISN